MVCLMLDKKESNSCEEILASINRNNDAIRRTISEKDKEIQELSKKLDLSEERRKLAEDVVTQIKEKANEEIKIAYKKGYDAASYSTNPTGGTTISADDKKLVLSNGN